MIVLLNSGKEKKCFTDLDLEEISEITPNYSEDNNRQLAGEFFYICLFLR